MDWNNDGRIDGFDYALFHNVISEEGGSSSDSGKSSGGGGSYSSRNNTSSTNKSDSNNNNTPVNANTDATGCATLAVIGLIIYMFIKLFAG